MVAGGDVGDGVTGGVTESFEGTGVDVGAGGCSQQVPRGSCSRVAHKGSLRVHDRIVSPDQQICAGRPSDPGWRRLRESHRVARRGISLRYVLASCGTGKRSIRKGNNSLQNQWLLQVSKTRSGKRLCSGRSDRKPDSRRHSCIAGSRRPTEAHTESRSEPEGGTKDSKSPCRYHQRLHPRIRSMPRRQERRSELASRLDGQPFLRVS